MKNANNNIRRIDIIKYVGMIMAFGCGVGATMLYEKYNKDIMKEIKKATKKVKEVK